MPFGAYYWVCLVVVVVVGLSVADGFVVQPSAGSTTTTSRRQSRLDMSLRPLHDELCNKLTAKLQLQVTDFSQTFNAQSWSASQAQGTADWWTEINPTYLTGVSTQTRQNDPAMGLAEELTLNIWMGPSYDVPHMLLTYGEAGNGQYHVTADYVPRGPTVLGSDPQYLQDYYGPDVQTSWTEAYPQPGQASSVFPLRPSYEMELRLLESPARISVVGLDANQAAGMVQNHVDRFLAWLDRAAPIPARSRGAFNLRDDKLRQYYYQGQMKQQTRLLGNDAALAQTVAAVNTGPTAEAYVGGGS